MHISLIKSATITYSVLISYCFALHPYEKHELIKPEWVIDHLFQNLYEIFLTKWSKMSKVLLHVKSDL